MPAEGSADAAIRNAAADGLIVYSLPADDPLVAAALQRRLPTAIVDSPSLADLPAVPGDPPDFVGLDDAAGAEAAVRHLLELGHRRLGILSLPLSAGAEPGPVEARELAQATASVPKARIAGCERALAAYGLGWEQVAVEQVRLPAEGLGRAAAGALLDRSPGITAIFAFSDQLARGARLAARERGVSLSIVGFDDTAPVTEGLTTVAQPLREKGRLAARRLLQTLAGHPPPPAAPLPARLVVRGSTAPPRDG
jgi:DNA-binding LacI/PurR family transcriptional regulator